MFISMMSSVIIHECVKIFGKNIEYFSFVLLLIINQHFFSSQHFLIDKLDGFSYWMNRNFMYLKSRFLVRSLSALVTRT